MTSGWQTKSLGEICDIVNGSTPLRSNKEFWDNGDINWFTINDIREQGRKIKTTRQKVTQIALKKTSLRVLPPKSILLCCTASIGEYAITEAPMATNQQFNGLIVKNQQPLEPLFLFHFCATLKDKLGHLSGKTTIDFISISKLRKIKISYPSSLNEQQRIVSILDEAFAGIATATANAEQNLANARELFESYLQSVFESKGEDWEEKALKEVCELKSGTTISPSLERSEGDVLYTKVGDMNLPENTVEINTSSRFVNSNEIKMNQIIPEGAIIFPKRGGAIATNKKRRIVKPTIVDLNTMALIPSKKINKDYLFHWFQLFDLNSISNGANVPQINNYSFDEVYIAYPTSLIAQEIIVKKLDELSVETKRLEAIYQQKLKALEELKKSILNQAFNGQLQ